MSEAGNVPMLQRATELVEQTFQDLIIPLYYKTSMARTLDRGKPLPYLQVVTTLVREFGLKTIVEIGSMRGPMDHALDEFNAECCNEGHSTLFFAETGAEVYTTDVNPYCAQVLVPSTRKYHNLHVYTADGIWFLKRFEQDIDLLYLDAWDVIAGSNYAEKHLEAYLAALPRLARSCLVLIDDTDILNGGKGRLVIPQMIRDGFDLVTWGRQALLVRT
jgi:hypothetical protein